MSNEYFEIDIEDTKNSILERIPKVFDEVETVNDLYIVDKEYQFLGMLTLGELLSYSDNVNIRDVMQEQDIISLGPDAHWKDVAEYMNKYNLFNIPIIENGELLGVVSVDDILPYLLNEKS